MNRPAFASGAAQFARTLRKHCGMRAASRSGSLRGWRSSPGLLNWSSLGRNDPMAASARAGSSRFPCSGQRPLGKTNAGFQPRSMLLATRPCRRNIAVNEDNERAILHKQRSVKKENETNSFEIRPSDSATALGAWLQEHGPGSTGLEPSSLRLYGPWEYGGLFHIGLGQLAVGVLRTSLRS